MKITVNYRCKLATLLALSGLGVSACAPVALPQIQMPRVIYPVPASNANAQVQQNGNKIPVAGALPNASVQAQQQANARRQQQAQAAANARARQAQANKRPVTVPPVLRPAPAAQRQAAPQRARPVQRSANTTRPVATNTQRYTAPRPSASVSRAPAAVYKNTNTQPRRPVTPRPAVRQPLQPRQGTIVARPGPVQQTSRRPAQVQATRPAPRPTASVNKPAAPAAPAPAVATRRPVAPVAPVAKKETEVLDLSTSNNKPSASVATEKPAAPPPAPRASSSPAVTVLIKQANNELSAGKNGRAASTLERALRIAPDDALLWLRLAEVNSQQGNKVQAASMARKAMGLAPDDAGLQARGQRLLN